MAKWWHVLARGNLCDSVRACHLLARVHWWRARPINPLYSVRAQATILRQSAKASVDKSLTVVGQRISLDDIIVKHVISTLDAQQTWNSDAHISIKCALQHG